MICVSIQDKTLGEIYDILSHEDVEMAEIRIDRCRLSEEDRELLFSTTDKPLVATCRIGGAIDAEEAEEILLQAIEDGAAYVDVELEAPAQMSRRVTRAAHDGGVCVIRSWHDFRSTPTVEELAETARTCLKYGADIVKIATMATDDTSWERVASLYGHFPEGKIVAFCMGEAGWESRLEALRMGAPFTYAALAHGECTAPGQWTLAEMNDRLYGGRRRFRREGVEIPASKSFAQRAIITAALAEGVSRLDGLASESAAAQTEVEAGTAAQSQLDAGMAAQSQPGLAAETAPQPSRTGQAGGRLSDMDDAGEGICDDTAAAIGVARAMGAEVHLDGSTLTIKGIGPIDGDLGLSRVDVGESGLLTRLIIPVMAGVNGAPVEITGRGTLPKRPLDGAADIMASFGVILSNAEGQSGKDIKVPLKVNGPLLPGRADISGKGGSQLISGLLTALPLASGDSTLYVHDPKSIPYMFITLDVLKHFGVDIPAEMEGDEGFAESRDWDDCTAVNFHIRGGRQYRAADIVIERDWSGAAVFLAAGALFGEVSLSGLDSASLQADISIMDVLANAGACLSEDEDGMINACKAPLNAFDANLDNAPDLFPIVAVVAAFCPGESHIHGLGRLAGKESKRSQGIMDMLGQMGVDARRDGDTLIVRGRSLSARLLDGQMLRGGRYTSSHDHRMVMALKLAELGADSPIVIDDEGCVAKSFPGFPAEWADVQRGLQ